MVANSSASLTMIDWFDFVRQTREKYQMVADICKDIANASNLAKKGGTPTPQTGEKIANAATAAAAASAFSKGAEMKAPTSDADLTYLPKTFAAQVYSAMTSYQLPVKIEVHIDKVLLKNAAGTTTLDTYSYLEQLKKCSLSEKEKNTMLLRVAGKDGNRELTIQTEEAASIVNLIQTAYAAKTGKNAGDAAKVSDLERQLKAAKSELEVVQKKAEMIEKRAEGGLGLAAEREDLDWLAAEREDLDWLAAEREDLDWPAAEREDLDWPAAEREDLDWPAAEREDARR
eukprot:gene11278-13327_t